jgi:hypothetical protein
MPEYRLFYFERGRISGVRVIQAEDDASAIKEAGVLAGDKPAELWLETEKLKIFNPVL